MLSERPGTIVRDFALPEAVISPNALRNQYENVPTDAIASTSTSTHSRATNRDISFERNDNGHNDIDNDDDDDNNDDEEEEQRGGWLAMNKRAHRRAIAAYMAEAEAEADTEVMFASLSFTPAQWEANMRAQQRAAEQATRSRDEIATSAARSSSVSASSSVPAASRPPMPRTAAGDVTRGIRVVSPSRTSMSPVAIDATTRAIGTPTGTAGASTSLAGVSTGETSGATGSSAGPSGHVLRQRQSKGSLLERCGKVLTKKPSFWKKRGGEK